MNYSVNRQKNDPYQDRHRVLSLMSVLHSVAHDGRAADGYLLELISLCAYTDRTQRSPFPIA
jgi:hypothetical protein